MLPDRRRLGRPRPIPTDLEAPLHRGMAQAQNHLLLYQSLRANYLHRRRFVSTRALPRHSAEVLIAYLFAAVQFFDKKLTQEVRILYGVHRLFTSDANARTLELQEDLLV